MKRFFALTLAFLCTGVSPLCAQSQYGEGVPATQTVILQGVKTRTVTTDPKGVQRAATATPAPQASPQTERKSFWKTPWPYVIAGAVAVAAIIARANGAYGTSGGTGGTGGY
jgi:hypothetical protein